MSHGAAKKGGVAAPSDVRILACRALEPELKSLGVDAEQMRLLDQGLHRYPQDLHHELRCNLEEMETIPGVKRVVLVYGLCGGGLEGLRTRRARLILPLTHDCIPLLLGCPLDSPAVDHGGSYYLSPGWIDYGQTVYTEFFRTRERFGKEEALWSAKEMLKGYREVVLIRTQAGLTRFHREYAMAMAKLFDLELREVPGVSRFLEELITCSNRLHILQLEPGEIVSAERYRAAVETAP